MKSLRRILPAFNSETKNCKIETQHTQILKNGRSFYDLIRPGQHCRWNGNSDCSRSLEIDNELECLRLFNRYIRGLAAFQDFIDDDGGPLHQFLLICRVSGKQSSGSKR